MADERNEDQADTGTNQQTRSPQSAFGNQGQQASAFGSQQEQDNGGTSGQPIGGNDSSTGSGTTLTQGADFGGQSASGQAQPGGSGNSETLTADQGSNAGSGTTTGGSSGGSSGEGFIGAHGSGSDDDLQDGGSPRSGGNASSANATGGSDFADQGQGALDDEDDSDSGSAVGGFTGSGI